MDDPQGIFIPDWMAAEEFRGHWVIPLLVDGRPIGAIGFIGNQAAVVTAFFDDRDGNKDGEVSWGEWAVSKVSPISIEGIATTEVAMAARYLPAVVLRDEEGLLEPARLQTMLARNGITVCELMSSYWAHWNTTARALSNSSCIGAIPTILGTRGGANRLTCRSSCFSVRPILSIFYGPAWRRKKTGWSRRRATWARHGSVPLFPFGCGGSIPARLWAGGHARNSLSISWAILTASSRKCAS
jgi:hypothetical protein